MQDHPGDEGIQGEAAPLRSRRSPPEAPPTGGEARPLHAEFTISIEDALAIHDRAMLVLKAGALKPSRGPRVIGYGIGAVYFAVYFAEREGLMPAWGGTALHGVAWMFAGSFLTLVFVVLFLKRSGRAAVRRITENDRSLFVTHHITLTPESVNYTIGPRSGRLLWEGVVDLTETPRYLFISSSPTDIILVPRHAFASRKEFAAFVEGAERYFEASGSAGRSARE